MQRGSLVATLPQNELTTVFLPSIWPVEATSFVQVQWIDLWTCFDASVWQVRQALVTSGPVANGPFSASNFEWSAVLRVTRGVYSGPDFGASSVSFGPVAGAGAGAACGCAACGCAAGGGEIGGGGGGAVRGWVCVRTAPGAGCPSAAPAHAAQASPEPAKASARAVFLAIDITSS